MDEYVTELDEIAKKMAIKAYKENHRDHVLITYNMKVSKDVINFTKGLLHYVDYSDHTSVNCILMNMIACLKKGKKLSYPRDKNLKVSGKKMLTPRRLMVAVAFLEMKGYLTDFRGKAHSEKEHRVMSYVLPTDKFIGRFYKRDVVEKSYIDYLQSAEGVELRDAKTKQPKEYRGNKMISEIESFVRELNQVNESAHIHLRNSSMTNIYKRIYTDSFSKGGRFYRAEVLNINNSEDQRLNIIINDNPVVEVDYAGLHFRMVCALRGWPSDEIPSDPYIYVLESMSSDEYTTQDRYIIKRAVNTMFNAKSVKDAIAAINHDINKMEQKDRSEITVGRGGRIYESIIKCYPEFELVFCQADSFGLVLQNKDSDLAAKVMKPFVDDGIPILPVHDSFIVESKHEQSLVNAMIGCFQDMFYEGCSDNPVPVKSKKFIGGELIETKYMFKGEPK